MASIPDPIADEPPRLPDAANAAVPGHLLRTLELRTGLEYLATRRAMRRIADWPPGDGHPVLVLPGFLAGPLSTHLLRNVLRRWGYRVYDWGLGYNVGYRASMRETLPARLHQIRERTGDRRVSLIGWSAGGIYARELARNFPDDVRLVITLGSPFRGNHRATTAWKVWRLMNRGTDATQWRGGGRRACSPRLVGRLCEPRSPPGAGATPACHRCRERFRPGADRFRQRICPPVRRDEPDAVERSGGQRGASTRGLCIHLTWRADR